eukprot:260078_1
MDLGQPEPSLSESAPSGPSAAPSDCAPVDIVPYDSAPSHSAPIGFAPCQPGKSQVRNVVDGECIESMSDSDKSIEAQTVDIQILFKAVKIGDTSAVHQFLLHNPTFDVNSPTDNGWPPLVTAALKGHADVVKLLLNNPSANVNIQDGCGQTSLFKAAYRGHYNIVKILLGHPKIDVNLGDNCGCTPLC